MKMIKIKNINVDWQAMLFVMEFKCKLYQQDSTLQTFVKSATQVPGITSELLEACGQYAYQAAFRNVVGMCFAHVDTFESTVF
jgi:hypothetical protein